jgi:hypothetical protein
MDNCENIERKKQEKAEYQLMFAEDFTANALLQVRVYWTGTCKIHDKPFLTLVSAAPQAPAGTDGCKTYLLERPYGITMKFSVEELAAFAVALDRIASGAAGHYGIDNTWVKWADPAKAKGGNATGIGKKMLSVMPVQKRGADAGRSINISFHCILAADTEDPRGVLANCRRDGRGIKYGVTVNMGAYQAMAASLNLVSLAGDLTDINRRYRFRSFGESADPVVAAPEYRSKSARRPAPSVRESALEYRSAMRLHNNDRSSW